MKSISGKKFAKLLEKKGWMLTRINGSHHIYMKEGNKEHITIPVHKNQSLKIGLQRYFMKIANIDEAEL
jgi:predicted RNA binding protein YcfA (HicA-like mRNA interferase family)